MFSFLTKLPLTIFEFWNRTPLKADSGFVKVIPLNYLNILHCPNANRSCFSTWKWVLNNEFAEPEDQTNLQTPPGHLHKISVSRNVLRRGSAQCCHSGKWLLVFRKIKEMKTETNGEARKTNHVKSRNYNQIECRKPFYNDVKSLPQNQELKRYKIKYGNHKSISSRLRHEVLFLKK